MPTMLVDRSDEDAGLYDALTGLPGRLLQRAHLVHALKRADRNRSQVAVVFLDVDDFADLNDRIGRELADQVLVVLAARIQAVLRGTDMTARLDGDEFVVVCEDLRDDGDVPMLVRRLTDAMSVPMRIGDQAIEVRVTAGAALSAGGQRAGELLNAANKAMSERRGPRRRRVP
jgi:diguanylate cyclase (GGDEF)-like protein